MRILSSAHRLPVVMMAGVLAVAQLVIRSMRDERLPRMPLPQ